MPSTVNTKYRVEEKEKKSWKYGVKEKAAEGSPWRQEFFFTGNDKI